MLCYLVATDFSPEADHVIRCVLDLARKHPVKVILIHSTDPLGSLSPPVDAWSTAIQRARRSLSRWRRAIEAEGHACDTVLSARAPAEAIARCADEWTAELIAISSRSSRGDPNELGHVTKRVLELARCPVMVVPAENEGNLPGRQASDFAEQRFV